MGFLFRLLVVVFSICLSVTSARARETLCWGAGNNPPFNILAGKEKGNGYSDILQHFFAERMPEYDHKIIRITLPRLLEQAAAGKNFCYCNLRKTPEREEILLYSSVLTMGLAPRVYALEKSLVSGMALNGVVRLTDVLSVPGLRGLFRRGRSWGASIDSVLRRFNPSGGNSSSTTIKDKIDLVCAGRADYFIEYPFAVERLLKKERKESCLVGLKIKGQPEVIKAYIGCSDTQFGRKVIDQINEIVRKEKGSPEYRKVFMAPAASHIEESVREMEWLYDQFISSDANALRTVVH